MGIGNAAVVSNLAAFKATDKTFLDQVYQADGQTAQDVTGWGLTFVIHQYDNPAVVFVTKSTATGGISLVQPTTNGQISISLAAADTAGLWPGQYSWYCEKTDPGADDVISIGLFTLMPRW